MRNVHQDSILIPLNLLAVRLVISSQEVFALKKFMKNTAPNLMRMDNVQNAQVVFTGAKLLMETTKSAVRIKVNFSGIAPLKKQSATIGECCSRIVVFSTQRLYYVSPALKIIRGLETLLFAVSFIKTNKPILTRNKINA